MSTLGFALEFALFFISPRFQEDLGTDLGAPDQETLFRSTVQSQNACFGLSKLPFRELEPPWAKLSGLGLRAQGSRFRVQGSGFRVQGSGFRVQGSGFRVQGLGVQDLGFKNKGLEFRGYA